jgi:hypothetical protein
MAPVMTVLAIVMARRAQVVAVAAHLGPVMAPRAAVVVHGHAIPAAAVLSHIHAVVAHFGTVALHIGTMLCHNGVVTIQLRGLRAGDARRGARTHDGGGDGGQQELTHRAFSFSNRPTGSASGSLVAQRA